MVKRSNQKRPRIMSASHELAVLCGLLICGGAVIAQEEEAPDLTFLEYLGSWEESDEVWVLLSLDEEQEVESDANVSDTVPAAQEERVAELDDEN